jgi:tetraprenyl-beta-curcumene synthase
MAFLGTLAVYSATILPVVARELAHRRSHARAIPDATLRRLALEALDKRGNMQGAALFAVLAPRRRRTAAARALIAFQSAYNYLDALAEQPNPDPVGNGRRLHEALTAALDVGGVLSDHYAFNAHHDDHGYLAAMVASCREAVGSLPSYELARGALLEATQRIVDFQTFNLGELQGGTELLRDWGDAHTPPGSGLQWWETAAAGGSSLGVHALIALAARPGVLPAEIRAVDDAYFPWIGSLHSLLDSAVDIAEDRRARQRNLLGYYPSLEQAEPRLALLAERAARATRGLQRHRRHEVILAAMAGYYLSAPTARGLNSGGLPHAVTEAVGPLGAVAYALIGLSRGPARLLRA